MPRKKLTKAQVRSKLKRAATVCYDLFIDKMGHGAKSHVPMSEKALMELNKKFVNAWNRTH